jgi:hypothetical protein
MNGVIAGLDCRAVLIQERRLLQVLRVQGSLYAAQ